MTPTEAISILRETIDDAHNYVAHQSADYATKNNQALTLLTLFVLKSLIGSASAHVKCPTCLNRARNTPDDLVVCGVDGKQKSFNHYCSNHTDLPDEDERDSMVTT